MNDSPIKLEIYLGLYESLPDLFLVNAPWAYILLGCTLLLLCIVVGVVYLSVRHSPHLSSKVSEEPLPVTPASKVAARARMVVLLCLSPLAVLGVMMPPTLFIKNINDRDSTATASLILPFCAVTKSQNTHLKFKIESLAGEVKNASSKVWLNPQTRELLEKINDDSNNVIELDYKKGALGLWNIEKIKYISLWQCVQLPFCDISRYNAVAKESCDTPEAEHQSQ